MGIYGHMVNRPSATPEGGGGEKKEENDGDSVSMATMKDLEQTLEELNKGIDSTLSQQGEYGASISTAGTEVPKSKEEDTHFTLASSPTYTGPLREKDDK